MSSRAGSTGINSTGMEEGIGQIETSDDESAAHGKERTSKCSRPSSGSESSGRGEDSSGDSDTGRVKPAAGVLDKIEIIRPRKNIFSHESNHRGPNGLNFSMDAHCPDSGCCTCGDDIQNGCPGWVGIDLLESCLTSSAATANAGAYRRNDPRGKERLNRTFALLNGNITALKLKISVNFPRMDNHLFWYSLFVTRERTGLIENKRRVTLIVPLSLNTIDLDTVSDADVTDGSGIESFMDCLNKGRIRAEVWNTTRDDTYSGPAKEDLDSESDECEDNEEELACAASNQHDEILRDDVGVEAHVKSVDERHRKIGYLEFTPARGSGRHKRPSSSTSTAEKQSGVNQQHIDGTPMSSSTSLTEKSGPAKKRKSKQSTETCDSLNMFRGKKRIARVDVIARTLENLIRNSTNRRRQMGFVKEIKNGTNIDLPNSEVLEKLGVDLYTMEDANIEMTAEQRRRRQAEKEVHCIDSSGEESDDNTSSDRSDGLSSNSFADRFETEAGADHEDLIRSQSQDEQEISGSEANNKRDKSGNATGVPVNTGNELGNGAAATKTPVTDAPQEISPLPLNEQAESSQAPPNQEGTHLAATTPAIVAQHIVQPVSSPAGTTTPVTDAPQEISLLPLNEQAEASQAPPNQEDTHPAATTPAIATQNIAQPSSSHTDTSQSETNGSRIPLPQPPRKKTLLERVTDVESELFGDALRVDGVKNVPTRLQRLERELELTGLTTPPLSQRVGNLEDVLAGRFGPSRGGPRQRTAALETQAFGEERSESPGVSLMGRVASIEQELGNNTWTEGTGDQTLVGRLRVLEAFML